MAIADMLDTWEEWQEETRALRSDLSKRYQEEARESTRREMALLEVIILFHDQFHALKRAAEQAGDSVWKRQLEFAEEKLSGRYPLVDLQVINAKGAPVNYDLHEVIGVEETSDRAQTMRVADVYVCGYAYRGKVVRKAKVSAYQWTGREESVPPLEPEEHQNTGQLVGPDAERLDERGGTPDSPQEF